MDTAQWPQDMLGLVKPNNMEETNNNNTRPQQMAMERRLVRPQKEQALNCPRCNSTNTKFCYYNNYSLTQPRYFCKTCRRYWTEGGSLRNVPVGGGSRKNNKRSSPSSTPPSSSSSSSSTSIVSCLPSISSKKLATHEIPNKLIQGAQDLNLAFNAHNTTANAPNATLSAINHFMPMNPMAIPEYPLTAFPLDIGNSINGGLMQEGAKVLFPFEETRQIMSSSNNNGNGNGNGNGGDHDQFHEQSKGFWSGMMGGGGSW